MLFIAVSFFMPVSADIDFIDVSFFMPVSAAGAGAIAGAAVDDESAVVVPVSFALHATATTANAAATRARRFITQSPDQGVGNMGVAVHASAFRQKQTLGIGRKLLAL